MNTLLKQAFDAEMATSRLHLKEDRLNEAFRHLERAHVLGQRYVIPHVQVHWLMLRIGIKRHSASEIMGQAIRIAIGALGSAIGLVPIGNTGGTNISMFKRLPIASDIAPLLGSDKRHR